jgi:hypothetical protein
MVANRPEAAACSHFYLRRNLAKRNETGAASATCTRRDQIMPNVIDEIGTEVLQAFADAWNRHDGDALMSFMTDHRSPLF